MPDPETIIEAKPPIEIGAGHAASFTISYFPNSVGECGPWATDASAILVFDNGDKVYSLAERITGADVRKYNKINPNDEKIIRALKHRDPGIRKQAVGQLQGSSIDRDSIKMILEVKLRDENQMVRVEAAKATSVMRLRSLTPSIASLLKETQDNNEMTGYCEALRTLKDPSAIDALTIAITTLSFDNAAKAAEALVSLEQPEVPAKFRTLLTSHIKWAQFGASGQELNHYLEICRVLIGYRDMESGSTLSDLLSNPQFQPMSDRLAMEIVNSIDQNELLQDPFFIALKNVLEKTGRPPVHVVDPR